MSQTRQELRMVVRLHNDPADGSIWKAKSAVPSSGNYLPIIIYHVILHTGVLTGLKKKPDPTLPRPLTDKF